MSQAKDGGPAFPCPWGCDTTGQHLPADPKGMSLRDYFAAQALVGYLAAFADPRSTQPKHAHEYDRLAREAYKLADAMLLARKNGGVA